MAQLPSFQKGTAALSWPFVCRKRRRWQLWRWRNWVGSVVPLCPEGDAADQTHFGSERFAGGGRSDQVMPLWIWYLRATRSVLLPQLSLPSSSQRSLSPKRCGNRGNGSSRQALCRDLKHSKLLCALVLGGRGVSPKQELQPFSRSLTCHFKQMQIKTLHRVGSFPSFM